MLKKSDKELWSALKSGDHTALEHIYRLHFPFLYNYGRKIAYNDEMVEDAIQELFIELWEKRNNLSDTDNIRPYLTISVKRKIIKLISKSRDTTSDFEEHLFGSEDAIEDLLINTEIKSDKADRLKKALNQLSSRQKEIIYLKYYQGMDYDDIAEVMGLNYQSSRNLVNRAIKKLATVMTLLFIFFLT